MPPVSTLAALDWPITFDDVQAARRRLAPYLQPTPLREYPRLAECAGGAMQVFAKHENHQPTNSFKIRNGLSFMTALERAPSGVAASSRRPPAITGRALRSAGACSE